MRTLFLHLGFSVLSQIYTKIKFLQIKNIFTISKICAGPGILVLGNTLFQGPLTCSTILFQVFNVEYISCNVSFYSLNITTNYQTISTSLLLCWILFVNLILSSLEFVHGLCLNSHIFLFIVHVPQYGSQDNVVCRRSLHPGAGNGVRRRPQKPDPETSRHWEGQL